MADTIAQLIADSTRLAKADAWGAEALSPRAAPAPLEAGVVVSGFWAWERYEPKQAELSHGPDDQDRGRVSRAFR